MALFLVFQQGQLVVRVILLVRPIQVTNLELGHPAILCHDPDRFLYRVAQILLGQPPCQLREPISSEVLSPSDRQSSTS